MSEDLERLRQEALAAARLDEERYASARKKALEGLSSLSRVMGLMAILAAPRLFARISAGGSAAVTQEHAMQLLDDYLAIIEAVQKGNFQDANGNIQRTEESTRRARKLIETWDFSGYTPASLVQAGRDYLRAYGLPEPEEGWDQWEGPSGDDQPHTST
ncbi:hypothetical protein BE08_39305 [Sorangium cellulosum]|uniref:Uncharacterized protein n=1 Tax=Sorangium cellulosum TaxID=56 RepID=A0A150P150_SORCE|nr:hypothetical protein BE08_39305 [Sorangium cellulosum]